MSKERLSMRKIKEVLRLKWTADLSARQIAKSCSIARSTVADYLQRAKVAGLSWPLPETMDHEALERLLFWLFQDGGLRKGLLPNFKLLANNEQ